MVQAPGVPPAAPPAPQVQPPLAPATLGTPGPFLGWLLRAQDQDRRYVGYSGDGERCPLATFAREALAVRRPLVAQMSFGEGPLAPQGLGLYAGEWGRVPLPEWCTQFVVRVDAASVHQISPKRALRILGEVLQNQEHSP